MSVVLTSMLHTTAEFNAFQIVVECHKFDMNESLIFHLWTKDFYWNEDIRLGFLIIDPTGMALFLDKGNDFDDPNSFLLLKTLARRFSLNLQMNFRAIEIVTVLPSTATMDFDILPSGKSIYGYQGIAYRARGAVSFLYNCSCTTGILFNSLLSSI